MSVQIISLRPRGTPEAGKKPKQFHSFTNPPVEAPSLKTLFENLEKYLAQIPKQERWNLFYTVAQCTPGKIREFVSQDVMAFDVDGIDLTKLDDYIPVVTEVLGLSDRELTVVSSGNGLHFIVQLSYAIMKDELPTLQPHYKALIKKLDDAMKAAGLPGHFDMILDSGRILRLPLTENRKPGKEPKMARFLQTNFTPHNLDLVQLSGLPEVNPDDSLSDTEVRLQFSRTDNEAILSGCEFLKWTNEHPTEVKEPQGYAALSILARMENGPVLAREAIGSWTGSGSIAQWDADQKIDQALSASGPRTCKNINLYTDACQRCAYNGKVKSPIAIVGPDFIKTEASGFHQVVAVDGKTKHIPAVHDLRKFFEKNHPYKVINRNSIYRWDGKQYEEMHSLGIRVFAEEHFDPHVKRSVIDEFADVVVRYNIVKADWFAESTEGYTNFTNGVLETKTGKLHAHNPERGFRYMLPFDYDASATAPRWEKFLHDVFEGDQERMELIEEIIGYALSGDPMWMHKALVLVGSGSNGKSTLIDVMQRLAGRGNFSSVKVDQFNNPQHISMMDGKLFNVSGETARRGFDESAGLKELTGGDTVTARKLYSDPYEFSNRAKIIFACNEIPRTVDNTHGFYRRFWVVEFNRQFDPSAGQGEYNLSEKLAQELPGIYNRVRAAYLRAKGRQAFTVSRAVNQALEDLREEMDVVGTWIADHLEVKPGGIVWTKEIYERFASDMESEGNGHLLKAYPAPRLSRKIGKIFSVAKGYRTRTARGLENLTFKTG